MVLVLAEGYKQDQMNIQRPLNVLLAASLLEVFSALNLVSPLILGAWYEVPAHVGYSHVALGAVGLVASYGLWILKKWGSALTTLVYVLNALSAIPSFSFTLTSALFGSAAVGAAVFALIVVLVLLPGTPQNLYLEQSLRYLAGSASCQEQVQNIGSSCNPGPFLALAPSSFREDLF